MDYYESLRFLYSLADFERTGRFADRKDVAPMLALLTELSDPHLGRVTVHIAGSKGKGSVAAMVESMLRASGVTTGLTTSPHLHKITERVQIDGAPCRRRSSRQRQTRSRAALEKVQASLPPERQLVTFDAITALAFVVFRDRGVQAQVVEVGLGGLLDSTNVFEKKDVRRDHQHRPGAPRDPRRHGGRDRAAEGGHHRCGLPYGHGASA